MIERLQNHPNIKRGTAGAALIGALAAGGVYKANAASNHEATTSISAPALKSSETAHDENMLLIRSLRASIVRANQSEAARDAARKARVEAAIPTPYTGPIPTHTPAPTPTVIPHHTAAEAPAVIATATPRPKLSESGSLQEWLLKLRMCESGGNYAEDTGNGYYGAYQFSLQTWEHWKTGYARADLAPSAVQDATIVENTLASSGGLATQNPGCYHKESLSQFPPAG